MDGLRPERDELDRFQSRSAPSKPKKQKAKGSATPPTKEAGSKGSAPLFVGGFVLTLVLFGFLGWAHLKQAETLKSTEKDLAEVLAFVNQSKLSMARLEGELNAELEESGSAAEQLRFLDSEMRKLWGVAGDKNKKAIAQNKDAISGLGVQVSQLKDKQVKALQAQIAEQGKQMTQLQSQLSESKDLAKQLASLKKQIANGQGELALTREALEANVESLGKRVATLDEKVSGLANSGSGQLALDNAKAIASIDASRRQLNERIVALDRRLNELKLQVSASSAP